MARDAIQFQDGLSLSGFLRRYGSEEQCEDGRGESTEAEEPGAPLDEQDEPGEESGDQQSQYEPIGCRKISHIRAHENHGLLAPLARPCTCATP